MTGPDPQPILFAHANGFPASCYRGFLATLASSYAVSAPPLLGQSRAYPVRDGWHELTDELLDWQAAELHRPAIGIGHSMGAVLVLRAALRQPRRFERIILLDPPLFFGGMAARLLCAAKRAGLMDRLSPAGRSLGRRREWADTAEAHEYFASRGLFREFDETTLSDYVAGATRPTPRGRELVHDPLLEVAAFRTLPHDLHREPAPLGCPAGMLVAGHGSAVRPEARRRLVRRHGVRARTVEGDHLFPLNRPHASAKAVLAVDHDLSDSG